MKIEWRMYISSLNQVDYLNGYSNVITVFGSKRNYSLAPLVLRGACTQCTPQEKRQIQKVLAYVQKNYPKEWNKILQQYSG
ncbi:hypothetical protein HHI36_013133 [Cryptolaemus montrouzieri]|uniref:Uncharacterized protein n=1 Tax=Cryptolaemus montrouzieri TaxID=559131 RepID=A0ABD2NG79_9CUCU